MKKYNCVLFLIYLLSCKSDNVTQPTVTEGQFSLLTYNVAGLPQGFSASNPEQNIPQMSALLIYYDIVLVQEDFYYHEELKSQTKHPYQSKPKAEKEQFRTGDGLNRFSKFAFGNLTRVPWSSCSDASGFDCQAQKGFSVAETEIAAGVKINIYNAHLDSGGEPADIQARTDQGSQIISDIKTRSANKAIILAGDLNLDIADRPEDLVLLQKILLECGLKDACQELNCGTELVDRILFRSSGNLELTLLEWKIDGRFVDKAGQKLSDHFAVSGEFGWHRR